MTVVLVLFLFISGDEIEKVTDESGRSLFSEKKPELQETMVWYGIMYYVIVIITWYIVHYMYIQYNTCNF